jgi:UDP-N-acetylmuramoyl-L-alanyl-D-glutamate--2,6-diaminopimelate ligase
LSYDSRDVVYGTMFFCKGASFKEEYLKEAIEKGAGVYVSEKSYDLGAMFPDGINRERDDGMPIVELIVNDVTRSIALACAWFLDQLLDEITLVGITGTKGKSSTAYFVKSILDTWMMKRGFEETAILSSIDNYDGKIREESHLTTKESLDIYRHLARAVDSKIKYLTMEVSSQGLRYNRVEALPFKVGAFLSFGRDHISEIEHKDMEDYLTAKLKIFSQSETAVVNADTAEAKRVLDAARACNKLITYGWNEDADIIALEHVDTKSGSQFTARVFGRERKYKLGLMGRFNVDNALAAIAIANALGVPQDCITKGLRDARVPGRMEPFATSDGKLVIVDYAHNEMSFEALFSAVKGSYPDAYIAIVFGCPGYKALDRRHDLGTLAGRFADDIVLTEEDSGYEPFEDIANDIAQHVRAEGKEPRIIYDREAAIRSTIELAPEGAVILITGKGRETRQKRGSEYIEVISDVEIVENYINELKGKRES